MLKTLRLPMLSARTKNLGRAFLKARGFGQRPRKLFQLQIFRHKQQRCLCAKAKFVKTGDSLLKEILH